MALARALDERLWILNRAGRAAFVISGQGHEGAQIGVVAAMRAGHDWMAPYYRSIAAVLAFGMTPREVMLAQFARAADPGSGGRQMPSHYGHAGRNIYTGSSPVGTQSLHAVGLALAAQLRGTDQVAVAMFGEGTSNQGDVHEALNFAAIHRLPFVLVVENNGYSISVPSTKELALPDVAARAAGYGIPGVIVDGRDVLGCYAAAKEAIDRARRGEGPTLIEAKVTRMTSHSSDDQESKYRSADDLQDAKAHDPVPRYAQLLRDAGILTAELEATYAAEIKAAVEDATDWAEAQPDPEPESGLLHVYGSGPLS